MLINDVYFQLPNSFPTLEITSVYFVVFTFMIFVIARANKSFLRPFVLIIANMVFLWSFSWHSLMLAFLLAFSGYIFGIYLAKHKGKIVVTTIISFYIILLVFYKYANLININNIIMPLGLSFYVFKIMSYLFDIYRCKYQAERNVLFFLAYVTFFPSIVAGPIHRANFFLQELKSKNVFDYYEAKGGAVQLFCGIFEKMVFCDYIGLIVTKIFENSELFGLNIFLGILLYSFQIYLDFDALSNIAIGTSRLLGFNISKNFNSPYLSKNLKEFWRRWHISLSSWFKDYVYIPLGGSKKGKVRKNFNLLAVFLISGMWHGSTLNFIVWGVLHGLIQIIEELIIANISRLNIQLPKFMKYILAVVGILFNFLIVSFLWLIFRYDNLNSVGEIISKLFVWQPINFNLIGLVPNEVWWLIIVLAIVVVIDIFRNRINMIDFLSRRNFVIRWSVYTLMIGVFLVFGIYGGSFESADFIYKFF